MTANSLLNYFLVIIPYIFLLASLKARGKHKYLSKILIYLSYGLVSIYLYSVKEIDLLSMIYGLSVLYLSIFISIYSEKYIEINKYPQYTSLLIDLFSLTMVTAFISPNILGLLSAWTISEIIGFMLIGIGEEHSIEGSTKSSKVFLFVSALTFELSLFTLMYTILMTFSYMLTSTFGVDALVSPYWVLAEKPISIPFYIALIIAIGFIAKAGLVPLHFWLPSAHTVAPAPASALLSGVMTSMGIYGLLRIDMITSTDVFPLSIILFTLGSISILYGGLQAHIQRDGKKLLAYSTIAGNGFSFIILSYYMISHEQILLGVLLVSVLAHMGYKATLFLDIGLAEQLTGFRYIHRLRGLARTIPLSVFGGTLAFLSLIGIPPTTGFTAKLLSILTISSSLNIPLVAGILISIILYIVLSILIGIDYVRIYFGKPVMDLEISGRKTVSDIQQYSVLLLGLSNIFFTLPIILFPEYRAYLILYVLATPLLLILVYLMINVMRREA